MALTESDILTNVRLLLFDSASTRWADAELRFWLNDGQRRISTLRVDSCTATRLVQLVAGVKQTIPADAWLLLDIIRNTPASGASIAQGVRLTQLEHLTSYQPLWPVDTAEATVTNYAYDERNPNVFYVWPPVTAASDVVVEAVFAVVPTPTTTGASALSIGDLYTPALIDYVLCRALSKDAGTPAGMQRAQMHQQAFELWMASSAKTFIMASPNTATEGGTVPKAARGGQQ